MATTSVVSKKRRRKKAKKGQVEESFASDPQTLSDADGCSDYEGPDALDGQDDAHEFASLNPVMPGDETLAAKFASLNPLKRLREYIHVMEFKTGKGNEYGRFISSIERAEFQQQCELIEELIEDQGYTIAAQCDAMLAKLQVIGESVVGRARRGAAMQSAPSAVSGGMSSIWTVGQDGTMVPKTNAVSERRRHEAGQLSH